MQCANHVKKRSLETAVEPWSCTPKRMCLEAELPVAECPMEMSLSCAVSGQQPELQVGPVRPRSSTLCCPRCLGGEPGHINHIMGM